MMNRRDFFRYFAAGVAGGMVGSALVPKAESVLPLESTPHAEGLPLHDLWVGECEGNTERYRDQNVRRAPYITTWGIAQEYEHQMHLRLHREFLARGKAEGLL